MSHDKNLAVLTANQADRARKTTVALIVRGCFALCGRGFLGQETPFVGTFLVKEHPGVVA